MLGKPRLGGGAGEGGSGAGGAAPGGEVHAATSCDPSSIDSGHGADQGRSTPCDASPSAAT